MIKFFRKIRQNLLTENKFSKYLLYAIGEVLLVVIGILLALNINNRNELNINDTKIRNILKEIQQDLVSDVERSKYIFNQFIQVDSIQDLILNDKYTYDDYKSGNAYPLGMNYIDFVINNYGYDNLMRNIDNVPEKYQAILKDLKNLYVTKKTNIDVYNTRIRETVYKNIDDLWNQHSWFLESSRGVITDEGINYYLNNQQYKSRVGKYINGRYNTFNDSQRYRFKAIETYLKIKELIQNVDSIPKSLALESADTNYLNTIVGSYKIKNSLGVYWPENVKISKENNKILFKDKNVEQELLYHKKFIFFMKEYGTYAQFNKSKKGELFVGNGFQGNATYIKVE
jgi:hypothetical protein